MGTDIWAPSVVRRGDSCSRIVLLWNNCLRLPYAYGGRHVLHAAVSRDDGRSWRGVGRGRRSALCETFRWRSGVNCG